MVIIDWLGVRGWCMH